MKIIAHRGFSSRAPENTMAAFRLALDFDVDGLELDIQMSRDGELVICHDESLDRTTNGKGWIKDYTLAELRRFDAGIRFASEFKGEPIPTLTELLDEVKRTSVMVNIELKTGLFAYPGIEEKLVDLLVRYDMIDQVIVSSFNHYSLHTIKELCPPLRTGVLYMAGLYQPWKYANTVGASAVHPYFPGIKPFIVQGCRKAGIEVNVFTVDSPEDIRRMISLDVDGIITNFPDRVKAELTN